MNHIWWFTDRWIWTSEREQFVFQNGVLTRIYSAWCTIYLSRWVGSYFPNISRAVQNGFEVWRRIGPLLYVLVIALHRTIGHALIHLFTKNNESCLMTCFVWHVGLTEGPPSTTPRKLSPLKVFLDDNIFPWSTYLVGTVQLLCLFSFCWYFC